MYLPEHFREDDEETLGALVDRYPFGALVTSRDGVPVANHVPFIYDRKTRTLLAHVARANPQWRDLSGTSQVLVIFQGPHAYISPTWYVEPGVPTWNYAAVHVYGSVTTLHGPARVADIVERLTARFERSQQRPWQPTYDESLLHAIVGLEIKITRVEGKLKLSQNRSAQDRAAVIARLEASGADSDAALAGLMKNR
jgi:transcriptional regulator